MITKSYCHHLMVKASATPKFKFHPKFCHPATNPNIRAVAQPREATALLRQQKNYSSVKKEKGLNLP